jgi:hypothetical protein
MRGLGRPLEVVCRRSYQVPIAASGGRDASHAGTACFLVAAIIVAGRGHDPWRTLPVLLVVAFDACLGAMSNDVEWCLPVTAQGHLPTRLYGVGHDRLVAGGVLGGDVMWLLERSSEEVAMSALPWALPMATGQRAWVALLSLATNLRLITDASRQTLADWFPLELRGESSQSDASEHTPLAARW